MTEELDLAAKMGLPSLIGRSIGEEIWGDPYVIFPWIEHMEKIVVEKIVDLSTEHIVIVNAPPQVGKSSYVGILLPFWITGMFPDWLVMYLSYSDDFSTARGKDVRRLHERYGRRLFGTSIDPDFQSATDWRINGRRGGMLSAGIGGQITGRPGNVIIIDDLIKNAAEASSAAVKRLHVEEWDGTIARRIQPGTTVIIIATRWAEDDLSGVLIERSKDPDYDGPEVTVLEFPAFALPPDDVELTDEEAEAWRDILGRMEDEVLDCRFSRIEGRPPEQFFRKVQSSMDAFAFSCLYQQRPSAREGGMFPPTAWAYYDPDDPPPMDRTVRVWDLAATEGGGDWTTGTLVGRSGDNFYILDVQRKRLSAGDVQDLVLRIADADGTGTKVKIEQEKGGAGPSVIAAYQRLLVGYNVEPAKAEGSKEQRATPYSAEQNKRRVFLPRKDKASWDVREFIDEHKKMMGDGRRPRHDDQIDTAAYAVLDLLGNSGVTLWTPGMATRHFSLSPEAHVRRLLAQPTVSQG